MRCYRLSDALHNLFDVIQQARRLVKREVSFCSVIGSSLVFQLGCPRSLFLVPTLAADFLADDFLRCAMTFSPR